MSDFYGKFQRARHIAPSSANANDYYFEYLINIILDGKLASMSLAVQIEFGSDGLAVGFSGYINSISKFATQSAPNAPEQPGSTPFPVDVVMKTMMTTKENFAIIQFDISRFKVINETYGDKIGDAILEYIRRSLPEVWERESVSCRLGADIFTVFSEYSDIDELEHRIGLIQSKLQSFNNISYKFYFGVYLVKDKSIPLRKMVDSAGLMRKSAKNNAVKPIQYYEEKFIDELHNRHKIEAEMQGALESGQFEVYLQPKCRIADGAVVGAEALVRWNHPEDGMLQPYAFIPVFEANGFIEQLDGYVHRKICELIRKWLDMGLKVMPISVNVSRVYLNQPDLAERLLKIVNEFNIPLDLFQIEITETFENRDAALTIDNLKKSGFTLLMDDFGSGYSSLNTLRNTMFDVIKLDRGFLGDSLNTERGRKIVTHTIAMTNDIGLEMVAEGVETSEQATFLDTNGCKCAQGYLYSKPVPVPVFEKMAFGEACVTV
ncbi:MAG: putative bifunctional diguanylate cyclase/phosphodiesterase [Huintestinicola sp.]